MSTENDSSDGQHEDRFLAAEFALGLLGAADHERFAARLRREPALRGELRLWRERLSGLDSLFEEQPAPRVILARLEARLFPVPVRRSFWDSLVLWRALAAGGLAVAVAAVGFNLSQPQITPQQFATQLVAALQSQEGSGVEFIALYDEATGTVRLTSLAGSVPPDKDLELWYIKGSEPAVSMGVVPINAKTQIDLDTAARAKFGQGITLALTLEQKGGSPTGVAQGPIVAVGAAQPI